MGAEELIPAGLQTAFGFAQAGGDLLTQGLNRSQAALHGLLMGAAGAEQEKRYRAEVLPKLDEAYTDVSRGSGRAHERMDIAKSYGDDAVRDVTGRLTHTKGQAETQAGDLNARIKGTDDFINQQATLINSDVDSLLATIPGIRGAKEEHVAAVREAIGNAKTEANAAYADIRKMAEDAISSVRTNIGERVGAIVSGGDIAVGRRLRNMASEMRRGGVPESMIQANLASVQEEHDATKMSTLTAGAVEISKAVVDATLGGASVVAGAFNTLSATAVNLVSQMADLAEFDVGTEVAIAGITERAGEQRIRGTETITKAKQAQTDAQFGVYSWLTNVFHTVDKEISNYVMSNADFKAQVEQSQAQLDYNTGVQLAAVNNNIATGRHTALEYSYSAWQAGLSTSLGIPWTNPNLVGLTNPGLQMASNLQVAKIQRPPEPQSNVLDNVFQAGVSLATADWGGGSDGA